MRLRWLAYTKTLTLKPHLFLRFCSVAAGSGTTAPSDVAVNKVTMGNFELTLPELHDQIKAADFVAVDLEMTGITSAPCRESFEFDRSDIRYLKVKDSAEKFAVVQAGVCPFRWDQSKGSFVANPYTFFVFPRKGLPFCAPSDEFLCQPSSIDFLAKHQFDFNLCVREGISYLSKAQEEEAMINLTSAYASSLAHSFSKMDDSMEASVVSTYDLFFTERIKNNFTKWLEIMPHSPYKGGCHEENSSNEIQFETVFFKMRPAIKLNNFDSHDLKLIQMVLRKHFDNLVYIRGFDKMSTIQARVVYVDTEEDKSSLMREVQEDLQSIAKGRITPEVGFRQVIDMLVSEGKLIVGHNCFLDMAHIYNKFIGPLPSSMKDFVQSLNKNFPLIIDTKYILTSTQELQLVMKKRSKSLSSAFSVLCPNVSSALKTISSSFVKFEVEADETRSSSFKSGSKHEAGYDAFMTGCVFAQSCNILGIKFDKSSSSTDFAGNKIIKNYVNFLYPGRNSGTVVNLSTGIESPDSSYKSRYPTIVFANTVLIWGFQSKLRPNDMRECISKALGPNSVTSVLLLDPTAALVQFSQPKLVEEFLILKLDLERREDPISVLHPLAKLLEGGWTVAAKYDIYKDVCGASASKVLFADQAEAGGINLKIKRNNGSFDSLQSAAEDSVSGNKSDSIKRFKPNLSYEEILDSLQVSMQRPPRRYTGFEQSYYYRKKVTV